MARRGSDLTVAAGAVSAWSMGGLRSFHPQLTLTSSAPVTEVLTLLEAGLRDASFRVTRRSERGFRAWHVDWFDLVSGGINRTTLDVAMLPNAGRTTVLIDGGTFAGTGRAGSRKAAQGLSTTVEALRVRGHEVTATPWRAAPRD